MKRPPGIWILLSAGVLWLSLQDVYGIRATALIFGKSTTTTTSPSPVPNVTDGISDAEVVTESSSASSNSTKPTLTGIPQIDYLNDPNLPKELNGYNLSEYPFYERVPDPDEIDFKCDGLHDGFYASIPYKCQVYHHCLFGTRYDFLCANYTAFDQKTFICQFVSDVDCIGSKKFWHRNDALYKAASTTTAKPLNIYTTSSEPNPGKAGVGPRGKRRRPTQRRPQYDYYDYADYDEDYYDDRARPRRRRPRPRPRPLYDDEYEDYEEDSYEKRQRRPYNRRGGSERRRIKNRNKNRETLPKDEEERPNERKKFYNDEEEMYRSKDRRKPIHDGDYEDEHPREEKRKAQHETVEDERVNERVNERRKPFREEERSNHKRKPVEVDFEDDYDVRPQRPRKGSRRPSADDEYDDDLPRNGDRRDSRPRKKFDDSADSAFDETKPLVKPTTGTIYDRPRVAPRIKPPVPKKEAGKYAYKPISKITTSSSTDYEEYYADYDEDVSPKVNKRIESDTLKPKSSENKERTQAPSRSRTRTTLDEEDDALTLPKVIKTKSEISRGKDRYRSRSQIKTTEEPNIEEIEQTKRISFKRPSYFSTEKINRDKVTTLKEPEYYDDEYEIEKTSEQIRISTTETSRKKWKPPPATNAPTETSTHKIVTRSTTARTTLAPSSSESYRDQLVKIVKRPFLPSRGGNPYSSRGLQPVGNKALKSEDIEQKYISDAQEKTQDIKSVEPTNFRSIQSEKYSQNSKTNRQKNSEDNTPAPVRPIKTDSVQVPNKSTQNEEIKHYTKQKFREPISENDDDFKPIKRPQHILMPSHDENNFNGPRTTQKPKVPAGDPLDIYENEYDVTLNDALNPTLPNLPVKSNFPTGFSPAKDYTFSAFQRPRYVQESVINPANTEYVYQHQEPAGRQRYEIVPQTYNSRDQFVAPSNDFKNYFNPIVSSNSKRGLTQARTQGYFTTSY